MIRPDHVFQSDTDSKWYFWDETATAYLGPFEDEESAAQASSAYSEYLTTGIVTDPSILGRGDKVSWRDGEEF